MTAPGLVLGIDTSGPACAVALLGPGVALAQSEPMAKGQSEALIPIIEALLARAGAVMADLTRIAVCTGPGVFTGVRIGVAAARGLALGTGAPGVGVTRFAVLAAQAQGLLDPGDRVAIGLDARGGAVAWQVFADGVALGPPWIGGAEGLPPGLATLAGPGALATDGRPRLLSDGAVDPLVLARLGAVAPLGLRPAPLYLRGPDADLPRDPPPVILTR